MTARILTRLAVLYGTPDSPQPVQWMAEVSKLIGGYTNDEQDLAFDIVCRSHRGRAFPAVNEIATACADARQIKTPSKPDTAPKYPDWSKDAIAKADRLVVSDMGRLAADEGWVLALHDFIRKAGRLPNNSEVAKVKFTARAFDEAYAKCCRGEAGPLSAALSRLGESMIERSSAVAGMAYGEIK